MKKLYFLCRFHYNRKLIFTSASMPRRRTTQRETAESPCETGPIIEKAGSVHIRILAKPGAKHTSILDVGEQEVGVQIAAPPVDGEANEELIKYLSKLFGVKKSQIAVEKGSRSRNKVVAVSGASKEVILNQLKTGLND